LLWDLNLIEMKKSFYEESEGIREKIRSRIEELLFEVRERRVRDILVQRNRSSSFIKGVLVYYLHKGLGGKLNEQSKIDLASKIEVLCSAGAILDNVVDKHEQRNGETTYLKEYGLNMQLAASQYALHFGLRRLFPFLKRFCDKFADRYKIDQAVLGMVRTDINQSVNLEDHIRTIGLSNGLFNEVPLVMAASVATIDKSKIDAVGEYGFNLGIGLGIYEELRDLLGEHGRKRAIEMEEGRIIIPLHLARNSGFNFFPYLKRHLNEREYSVLLIELGKCGALNATRDLASAYFTSALNCLKPAVNKDCIERVIPLQSSVEESMEEMLEKTHKQL